MSATAIYVSQADIIPCFPRPWCTVCIFSYLEEIMLIRSANPGDELQSCLHDKETVEKIGKIHELCNITRSEVVYKN